MANAIPYCLVGSRHKATGVFFGFPFKDGKADIPADAHKTIGHVLKDHYAAMPMSEAIEEGLVDKDYKLLDKGGDGEADGKGKSKK